MQRKLPNQIMNLALTTLDEVVGKNGTKSLLNYTGLKQFIDSYPSYDLELRQNLGDFSRLLTGVIDIMGLRGARPILFRGGMRGFEIMRENYPSLWNLDHVEPSHKTLDRMFDEFIRIQKIMVSASTRIFGDIYRLYENELGLVLENHDCYWCKGFRAAEPICHGSCGFSYAIAKWILGPEARVEETECSAMGAECCRFIMYRPGM